MNSQAQTPYDRFLVLLQRNEVSPETLAIDPDLLEAAERWLNNHRPNLVNPDSLQALISDARALRSVDA